jgi:uncharacterized coiled-coil protein SlyX
MQIEVSATRVIDKLASKVGAQASEIAHLQATNEVLTERLREYVERDRDAKPAASASSSPPTTG